MRIFKYPALRRAQKELCAERRRYAELERKFWALHERFDYRMDVMANNVILARAQNPPFIKDVRSPEQVHKPPTLPVMTPAQAVEYDATMTALMEDDMSMSDANVKARADMGISLNVLRYSPE